MVATPANFFVVGTPIGNLSEITLRALEVLKSVDLIYCEDTRRTIKLLNHFEIQKPLRSCPYFKERQGTAEILKELENGKKIAYCSDAGMPGLSDPGALIVGEVRKSNFQVEVVGGVSALTSFIGGAGVEFESFRFVGFLPPRVKDRESLLEKLVDEPMIFFESPHRIESTLEILVKRCPENRLILAKELSKISECFFDGSSAQLQEKIKSWKGEWIGCLFPIPKEKN